MGSGRAATLGQLRESGYRPRSVKEEMRENLLAKLRRGERLFPEIVGYEETVIPQIQNAILSKHDLLLLGTRGQAKTRILRGLTRLLDEWIPVVAGSETMDDPFRPVSKAGRDLVRERGDDTPIEWVGRDSRYREKLATPDVTIADLIGEVDMVKYAEGRRLSDESVMHFGLIPRSNRGIFCINELPDLAPRIQVGLFNILEERDVQIRGFPIRLELDLFMAFSANPEDYTNRGRIVTPLKDRIGSVARTHYPPTREDGMAIAEANADLDRAWGRVVAARFMREIVEETARLARTSPHVNAQSGVSARMSIANLENVVSNAERRAARTGETLIAPRICDLGAMAAGSRGKIELTMADEEGAEDRLIGRLVDEAVRNVFDQHVSVKSLRGVVEFFENGGRLELGDGLSAAEACRRLSAAPGLRAFAEEWIPKLAPELAGEREAAIACVGEFLIEGLHVHNRLSKIPGAGGGSAEYRR